MKKFAIILFSVTVISFITSTTSVSNQKSVSKPVVASVEQTIYPIHPPVG